MNRARIGGNVLQDIKTWTRNPSVRRAVELHKEKARMAGILKEVRMIEGITQSQLAKKAGVSQSVIARIEGNSTKAMPRLDLFNKLLWSMGYRTHLAAERIKKAA